MMLRRAWHPPGRQLHLVVKYLPDGNGPSALRNLHADRAVKNLMAEFNLSPFSYDVRPVSLLTWTDSKQKDGLCTRRQTVRQADQSKMTDLVI